MKRFALLLPLFLILFLSAQEPTKTYQVPLPTSKRVTVPSPGFLTKLNGFPATIAKSPDGRYAAILNDGYGTQANGAHQSIAVLDLTTNQLTEFPDDRLGEDAHQTYFLGLAFSSDGAHIYASMASITDPTGAKPGNTGNGIAIYRLEDGKVAPERFVKIAPQKLAPGKRVASALRKTAAGTAIPYSAGLAVIAAKSGDRLLVANNLSDNVVLLDVATGRVLQRFDLSMHPLVPASYPYTVVVRRDGRRAWCSLWNASRVAELDLVKGTVVRWIPLEAPREKNTPGSHPTAMLLSPDEKHLFVTLSNADRVAVVPLQGKEPIAMLNPGSPAQKLPGSCPTDMALSADGNRLFVADACINAVAVFDMSEILNSPLRIMGIFPPRGLVPTGWYPSAVALAGDDLLIATAKGQGTGPNNFPSKTKTTSRQKNAFIATLLYGSLSRLKISEIAQNLGEFTRQVNDNNLFANKPVRLRTARGPHSFRHVVYIIKENRGYDQILGDLKFGDGDPSLTMFGKDVTPNLHKLALQFGVIDNYFASGEVSGNSHDWTMAAITSDYDEKTWQIVYRGRERTFDYVGFVADELPLEQGIPNIDDPATGYLWDSASIHGLSFRAYGEHVAAVWCTKEKQNVPGCERSVIRKGDPLPSYLGRPHGSPSPWPWEIPVAQRIRPAKAALRGHFNPHVPDFNVEYPDQLRADEFLNEFEGFVEARKSGKGTELPQLVFLYLPTDHTLGTTPGKPRPAASVADNDLAVGRVVEAISNSPYWDDTAIFIIEDDAQDGADHVDAHRSPAYVISKYSPGSLDQPFVDHSFYTTVNVVHTIETILGVPPMNQNDAFAPIMQPLFLGEGNQPPFKADWSNQENGMIYETNAADAPGAKESAGMDFSRGDADERALARILWRDAKGDLLMPEPPAIPHIP